MAASESCAHHTNNHHHHRSPSSSLATGSSRQSIYRRSEPKPILSSPSNTRAAYNRLRTRNSNNNSTCPNGTSTNNVLAIKRLEPLGIEEYENNYRLGKTDLELIERVFLGSFENNQLRAALWPYLFGLIVHRGRFEKKAPLNHHHPASEGFSRSPSKRTLDSHKTEYVFIEHEANAKRWNELEQLYLSYEAQWKAITRDQEERFTLFRERKALIGRDVIRCDRLHPFYAEQPKNLDLLSSLLMTYMMFDFDIGYVQGMSDLAGPILYIFEGDLVKSFWIFVEVMKLVRRNFEHTQKSIHFQLSCLFQLIRITDAKFAKYLEEQESSNCFFAFRAIVCQFKRELMKDDLDYYDKCLQLWDTIWCCERRCVLEANWAAINQQTNVRLDPGQVNSLPRSFSNHRNQHNHHGASWNNIPSYLTNFPSPLSKSPLINGGNLNGYSSNGNTNNRWPLTAPRDPNQPDTPRHNLTETEMYILALCLVMILRERDYILCNRLDGNDIHLHFIEPKLANDLNGFIQSAINTYRIMKNDLDLSRLTSPRSSKDSNGHDDIIYREDDDTLPLAATLGPLIDNCTSSDGQLTNSASQHSTTASCSNPLEEFHLGSPGSLEGYDFLNDFLIISRVPGR